MPFGDAAAPALDLRRATPPNAPAAGPQACTQVLALLAAVAVLWMATRPYEGVYHDARLYAVQALGAADPARFADDLFLGFGSQDRFTAFSRLYAPVLGWAGVSLGSVLLTLPAQAAWLCAAYGLARALLGDRTRALAAVAGLVASPSTYGAGFIFSFGEAFLTPRLFAEALVMLALAWAARGSTARAAAALAVAGAFHPIMAAPGAAVLFFLEARGGRLRRAGAACAAAAAAAAALAVFGVEPFARLGVRFDPLWFEIVRHRCAFLFVGGWTLLDCGVLAGQAALAALAFSVAGTEARRLLAAVLLTAAAGVVLTAVGADLARNQLVTNAQPWRAAWLLGVVAHLMAVPLLARSATAGGAEGRGPAAVALAAGVAVLFLARFLPEAHLWSAVLLTSAVLLSSRRGEAEPLHRALVAAAVALAAVSVAHSALTAGAALEDRPGEYRARLLSFGLCAAALGLAAAALRPGPGRGGGASGSRGPATVAAACLLVCAGLVWDRRTAWTRFVESPDPVPRELAAFVPDNETVYWDGGLDLLWLRLKRSSYHSCSQGAGVIFFRETALAFRHRGGSFRFEPKRSDLCLESSDRWGAATPDELRRACAREPGLDRIVLPYPVGDVPRREWVPPAKNRSVTYAGDEREVREIGRFYAYACDDLR